MRNKTPFIEYFWARVRKNDLTGCWNWIADKDKDGYGYAYLGKTRIEGTKKYIKHRDKTHRLSWNMHNGAIPEGLCVLHKCDNPSCVNPDHLFIGTKKQNSEDMVAKQRNQRGEQRPLAKVTEEQVREIRASKESLTKIGAKYGLAFQTVSQIKNRKTWRHVH